MRSIKIEEVGDIHSTYRYLEVFVPSETNPILDISITDEKELRFKYYASKKDVILTIQDWEFILDTAKAFLPKALADEENFNSWNI